MSAVRERFDGGDGPGPGAVTDPVVVALMQPGGLAAVVARAGWQADALCHEYPTLPWFPEHGTDPAELAAAHAVCRRCLVRAECMATALDLAPGDDHGIAGGTSPADRRALREGTTTVADIDARRAPPPGDPRRASTPVPAPRRARKARAPRKADLEALGRRLARLGTSLERRAGQAVKIADDHASTLRATGSGTGPEGRGRGGHSDPTAGIALAANPDASWRWAEHLSGTAAEVADVLDRLERTLDVLTAAGADPAPPAGAGSCQACHAVVTGTANDRIKSGFCTACYAAWLRQGRPDRAEFGASRRTPRTA